MSGDTDQDVDARLFHRLHGRWPDGYTPPTAEPEPPPHPADTTRPDDPPDPSTWFAVDLGPALDGDDIPPPLYLKRSDGAPLLYPGRVHWFQGEAESLKSWAAQTAAAEVLAAGGNVIYVDYEDDDRGIVARLRSLGVTVEVIGNPARFRYIRPDEPLCDTKGNPLRHMAELKQHLEHPWQLGIIDGVTEAMVTEGLELIDNTDVAIWQRRLPKRIAATGAAVTCVDHIAKNAAAGRFAIGGQHKLAGVTGATYKFTVTRRLRRPLNEPTTGRATITVEKDRPGWVRARADGDADTIAVFELTAYPDGGVTADLLVPADAVTAPEWAVLVEILGYVDVYDGASQRKIEENVTARAEAVRAAVRWLVTQQWMTVAPVGRSHQHSLTDLGRDRMKDGP